MYGISASGRDRAMPNDRLLVVDDSKPFLEFVRKVAVGLGYEVEVAADGAAFKNLYETFQPQYKINKYVSKYDTIVW